MVNDKKMNSLSRFNDEYLEFPPFVLAFNEIIELMTLFRTHGRVENMLILGESGTGKTTLCKLLLDRYPRIVQLERDYIPVLFVPIPPAATISSVAESMLARLGDPAPTSGTSSVKTARAARLARACGVELFLFDEANHIQDRGKSLTQYFVGDWIKSFMDEVEGVFVLLGLPRIEELLRVNEQLRRRFLRRRHMELGQDQKIAIEEQCLQLFYSLIPLLPAPFDQESRNSDELGMRLYYATDGRVAYLKELLSQVIRIVLDNNFEEITIHELERAFTEIIWPQGVGILNPFNPTFEFRRLNRRAEPFEVGANLNTKNSRRKE